MIARKKRMIQMTMTVIGIVIIIILSFLVILLRTDLLKSNEDMFYKYIAKNLEIREILKSRELSEYNNRKKKENYINNGTITLDKGNEDTYLKDIKILTEETNIPETKMHSVNIFGMYNDSDLFSMQYLRNDNRFGIKSNEIIDKYLMIENNNLQDFVKKWGVQDSTNIPDQIELKNKDFEIEDEEKKDIKDRYMKILKNNISKKKFKKQKNIQIQSGGNNIKAAEYSITLAMSEMRELERKILETAENDQSIIDIYIKMKDDINAEKEMKEAIAERLDYINNEEIANSENQNIIIKVYVNKGKLVKTIISQNIREYAVEIVNSNKIQLSFMQDISKRDDKYTLAIEKKIKTDDILYKVNVGNQELKLNDEISFNVKGDVNLNKLQEYYEINLQNKETTLKINYNSENEFKNDVNVDEINEDNSYNMNEMSPEYIMQLFTDIGNLIGNLYNEKMQEMGAIPILEE